MYDNHRLIGVWKLHGVVQHTVNLGTILKSLSATLNIAWFVQLLTPIMVSAI